MKHLALILSTLLFISCQNEQQETDADLVGKWKLTAVLMDPGDGSGTFQSVTSDKIVEFHADGTITSNGSICFPSSQISNPTSGTYSLKDSTIQSEFCMKDLPLTTRFSKKGATLIISYTCFEPCREKYEKL